MIARPLAYWAEAIGGHWCGDRAATVVEVGTDTRQIVPGMLFVALRGARFDGHDYAHQAIAAGARAVMVEEDLSHAHPELASCQLIVTDTRLALGLLAKAVRELWPGLMIALTGNSGKTTVKEMIATILSGAHGDEAVLATRGNLNNDIGAPLTLLRLTSRHRYAVIELGANHIGEIAWTAAMAQPNVVLITNVTGAHVGEFGGMGMIAQAKSELLTMHPEASQVILPADDRYSRFWQAIVSSQSAARLELFGLDYVEGWHAEKVTPWSGGFAFTLAKGAQRLGNVQLPLLGQYNVINALAAAAAAAAAGVNEAGIVAGLARCCSYSQRMTPIAGIRRLRILDDSYNANPGAMKAALATLATQPGPHWCFMGAMGELGECSARLHREIGEYAQSLGITLVTYGAAARFAAEAASGHHFVDWEALIAFANSRLPDGACVLVKGSHAMHMERLVAALCAESPVAM